MRSRDDPIWLNTVLPNFSNVTATRSIMLLPHLTRLDFQGRYHLAWYWSHQYISASWWVCRSENSILEEDREQPAGATAAADHGTRAELLALKVTLTRTRTRTRTRTLTLDPDLDPDPGTDPDPDPDPEPDRERVSLGVEEVAGWLFRGRFCGCVKGGEPVHLSALRDGFRLVGCRVSGSGVRVCGVGAVSGGAGVLSWGGSGAGNGG